jgi:hypothetical protein
MLEGVLVKQVRLVEGKHGMDELLGALLDVTRDGVEEASGGGVRREAEGDAELAIEVAKTERGVMAVGQAEPAAGMRWRRRAGLADARLSDEDERGALGQSVEEAVDYDLFGSGEPEVGGDLLGEGRLALRCPARTGQREA